MAIKKPNPLADDDVDNSKLATSPEKALAKKL